MIELALVLICSFLAAVALTPTVRSLAIRWGIVDRPDERRKMHGRVVARGGGTAVLGAVLFTCGLALFRFDLVSLPFSYYAPFLALMTAMVCVWLLGLADDIWTLRGRQKLAGQIAIATLLVLAGYQMDRVSLFGWEIQLGLFSIPASVFWLLATTNALNLIDGSDGLCSTLGAIICGALGVLASTNGHFAEAAIAFAFCGALLGFLVFNFPPANIFLGDSGSLLVGMVTGALAIRCSLKGPAGIAFVAPLAILFLPLLDSALAIVRRKLTGRSIYTTDRAHLHHSLKNRGLGDRSLLLVVAILSTVTAAGALASQVFEADWIAPLTIVLVFGSLVFTKAFGYGEMELIARRGTHFALSFVTPAVRASDIAHHKAVHLQGFRQWDTVWQTLIEFADREELCKLNLDLNVPWLEEGFHGTWQRSRQMDRLDSWRFAIPILAHGKVAGRLDVLGPGHEAGALETIARMVDMIEDLYPRIEMLMESQPAQSAGQSANGDTSADAGQIQTAEPVSSGS